MNAEYEIKVYTTPHCGKCDVVKRFLREAGFEFAEVNVAGNFSALREMVAGSGSRQVPVVRVGDQFVAGIDLPALKRLLAMDAG